MLERLYVNNFRCLENFTIDFVGRPSALIIGKNGSGKSTLLDALRVLQSIGRGNSRVKYLIAKSDFAYYNTRIPIRFEIVLKLSNKRFKYAIAFEFPDNFREARVAEEILEVEGKVLYSRKQGEINQAGGTFGLDWHLVGLPVITVWDRTGENLREQIRKYLASMFLIAPIPALMSGFAEEETNEIDKNAETVAAWLNALTSKYPAAYSVLDEYLRFRMPDLASFEREERGEKGKQLVIKFEKAGFEQPFRVDFGQLSHGEKCFFLSAIVVAANKMTGGVFCLWDEPDSHLSLPEVGHLITELRKMTNQSGQFIATSHHPETIRRFSGENTLVLTRRSHFEPTVLQVLADVQYSGDLVAALIRDEIIRDEVIG